MARFQMQMDTAHPVMFLADSAPIISVPPDTSAAFVTTTHDCLAFWVLSYVDGASIITIADEACDAGGSLLFFGSINASSGVLTLSDSSNFAYINIPVPPGRIDIHVWAEDNQHPEWVWLQLSAIRPI